MPSLRLRLRPRELVRLNQCSPSPSGPLPERAVGTVSDAPRPTGWGDSGTGMRRTPQHPTQRSPGGRKTELMFFKHLPGGRPQAGFYNTLRGRCFHICFSDVWTETLKVVGFGSVPQASCPAAAICWGVMALCLLFLLLLQTPRLSSWWELCTWGILAHRSEGS